MKNLLFLFASCVLFCFSCKDDDDTPDVNNIDAKISFQFEFDKEQERLDNFGNPLSIATGNAAQSPDINSMSVHYIELVPTQFTMLKEGAIVYSGNTQSAQSGSSFSDAIVFNDAIEEGSGTPFLEIDVKDIPVGTYNYLRASVTYQNGDIRFNLNNLPSPLPESLNNQKATIASFIGFNTFIESHKVKNQTINVFGDRSQGFWIFEPQLDEPYQDLYTTFVNDTGLISGQAPEGATTVVNPLAAFGVTLPAGTCIVTGKLQEPLVITGEEEEDIKLELSFSVNNSFEWRDANNNGEWDLDVSGQVVEPLVDMGLRGLIVKQK